MKWIIGAVLLVSLLAFRMVKSRGDAVIPAGHGGRPLVAVEKIERDRLPLPAAMEICSFESDVDFHNWIGKYSERKAIIRVRSRRNVTHGEYSLALYWRPRRPGAELIFIRFPSEWEGYRWFAFDAFNPQKEPLRLEMRIGDYVDSSHLNAKYSGFIATETLSPGWNRVRWDLNDIGKKIDLDSERKIIHLRLQETYVFLYLDNMRLQR